MISENLEQLAIGNVRAEVYDGLTGEVVTTCESHNVVTYSANKILARMTGRPGLETRYSTSFSGATSTVADDSGYYKMNLPLARYGRRNYEADASVALNELVVGGPIAVLLRVVLLDGAGAIVQELVVDQDCRLVDEETGIVEFTSAVGGTTGYRVRVSYLVVANPLTRILDGSESVVVGGQDYTFAPVPSDVDFTYGIDYRTGEIWFASPKAGVSVDYDYKQYAGVSFMGVSDRPAGHPVGLPVVTGDADKYKEVLDAEYEGTRALVQFPAEVIIGSEASIALQAIGATSYVVSSTNLPLIGLVSVTHSNGIEYTIVDVSTTVPNCVWVADKINGVIEFSDVPPSGTINVAYRWNEGSTVSFVADFPPGVPAAQDVEASESFVGDAGANTTYVLQHPVKIDTFPEIRVDGILLTTTQYTLNTERNVVTILDTLNGGEAITVVYTWFKTYVDIYEVGLFDKQSDGDMFSIAGIGPITKDSGMGMRIVWNITFLRGN